MKETSDGAPSPEELSLLEENYSTLQSFLSISHENITVEYSTEDENHKVSSIHFDKESHQIQENGNETHGNSNDPVKMLLNHPKRSSLKKSCLLPSRRVESFDCTSPISELKPSISELSSDEGEDDAKIHPNIFRNERRKSCYSWRLRQKETGSRNMNDRASTDSQVFEMIHLDENNEEVSSKDKIVTGVLIFVTLIAVCYLFWAQNITNFSLDV